MAESPAPDQTTDRAAEPTETAETAEPAAATSTPAAATASSRRLGALGGRTFALLAFIVVTIAVGYRLDWRIDWSADGRFSLAPELIEIVEHIDQPLSVVGVWTLTGEQPLPAARHESLDSALRHITDLNPNLSYRHIDSTDDQLELEQLREQYGDISAANIYVLGDSAPFRIPITGYLQFTLQRELGGALVTAASRQRAPIYVLQGHGELPVAGTDSQTIGQLIRRLELSGFTFDPNTGTLDEATLSRRRTIYGDGLLIIAGPTAPLGSDTAEKVHAYLRDGGAALIFVDHQCPDDLALVLRRWGILAAGGHLPGNQNDIAVLSQQQAIHNPAVIRSIDFSRRDPQRSFSQLVLGPQNLSDTAITKQSRATGQAIVSPLSTPVHIENWGVALDPQSQLPAEVVTAIRNLDTPPLAEQLMLLGLAADQAWVSSPNNRQPPPQANGPALLLAHALEWQPHPASANPGQQARAVIWGSRQAATNRWLADPVYANDLLVADMAAWALDRGSTTPIATQTFASYQVATSDSGLTIIITLLVAVLPCMCIGAAMLTWWDRR